jgi:predicted nuclease with TOPRIM domain
VEYWIERVKEFDLHHQRHMNIYNGESHRQIEENTRLLNQNSRLNAELAAADEEIRRLRAQLARVR